MYNCYWLVLSWLNEYKVTIKILKVAVNDSYSKVTVKHISIMHRHIIFPKGQNQILVKKKFVPKKDYHFKSVSNFMIFDFKNKCF